LLSSRGKYAGGLKALPSRSSFLRHFFQLAIVNILSNLMVPLAGLVDVAFLGHLPEIRYLAGVALATVLFNYIYWTFGFLRMGTTGMTAQAIGREDREGVILIGLRNGLIALSLGLLILVLQQPLRMLGFTLLSATPEVKASGQAYYDALIWGAPATLLNFVLIGWFLGRSQSGKVFLLSAVGNLSNVVLNYLFIVRWGWQSTGAGLGTAIAQYLMLLVGLILINREIPLVKIHQHPAKASFVRQILNPSDLRAAFALNGEILVRTFALVSTFAVFTNLSSTLGTEILSTNAVLLQVVTLTAYFIDGLAFATETLAGVFLGRGAIAQLTQLLWVSGTASLSVGILFAIAFILIPTPLFGLLTNHSAILGRISSYVGWLLPVLGFGAIAYMLDGYFLGLTAGRILRISVLAAASLGFAPMAIAAWYFRNTHLLWLSLALFMVVRALSLAIFVPRTLKTNSIDRCQRSDPP
jgi:multidrug resistance protein, MATE family